MGSSTSYSPVLTVACDTVPISMTTPRKVSVAPSIIVIEWDALTDMTANGGDIPIFYSVEYGNTTTGPWTALNSIGGGLVT